VLALRQFEQLNTNETAKVLGSSAPAAGKRFVRAFKRLKDILDVLPGGMGEFG
jgi:DNA-directed RNA polymerase specialized sigma24 family protein